MNEDNNKLLELFSTLEELTGLDICVYPSDETYALRGCGIFLLPHSYHRHYGDFCRIVKTNKTGLGCGGHDIRLTRKKSAEIGEPFVNTCHAGLTEVIIPVYGMENNHIATVFIGQVILHEDDTLGFPHIMNKVAPLGVDNVKLLAAYNKLPRMSREKLLKIGRLADLAFKGLGDNIDLGSFENIEMLKHYPQISRAVKYIVEKNHNVQEAEVAETVNLTPAYFSRLFKKVMHCNFQNYLAERRINHAKTLLHHTRLPISEITEKCGFSQQSYFTRRFKEATGTTPTRYRKLNK